MRRCVRQGCVSPSQPVRRVASAPLDTTVQRFFDGNAAWRKDRACAKLLSRMAAGQTPELLWIGCSDSRAPANVVCNSEPGSIFTARNIANTVVHTDMSMLSVVQYAVEVLGIRHVAVVGHTGCGGIMAALEGKPLGLIDNWLRHIQDTCEAHYEQLRAIPDRTARAERLADLHVKAGVEQVARMHVVARAWAQQQPLAVHGWKFDVATGVLHDLHVSMRSEADLNDHFRLPNKSFSRD